MSRLRVQAEVEQAMASTIDPLLQERRVGAALAEYPGDPDKFDLESLDATTRGIIKDRCILEANA